MSTEHSGTAVSSHKLPKHQISIKRQPLRLPVPRNERPVIQLFMAGNDVSKIAWALALSEREVRTVLDKHGIL